ncbi:MAG: hypothetical protein K2F94_03915, partial [Muribaculaceae bacterium]|nr:hypothetical protein [Muribaculaceae bacterium]
EGCRPIDRDSIPSADFVGSQYIMWTGLGYPPCSEIVPVWCRPDGVDNELRGGANGHSVMGDRVKARRDEVFPIKKGNGEKYIDMEKLYNADGTGYVQVLVPKNMETYRRFREKRGE